jgi:tetratricopeptide (TPR) repeat protein
MEMVAVLSAAGVRRGLLHDAGGAGVLASVEHGMDVSPLLVDRALGQLAERSLLTFSLDGETVIVHRLVMRVFRDVLARQGCLTAVCQNAALVLNNRARAFAGSQDLPTRRDIPEQVMALLKTAAGPAGEADQWRLARMLLDLRYWALYHLCELGDSPPQEIAVGEPLVADYERLLGPDNSRTVKARNNLASAYERAGRAADAIPLHQKNLPVWERLFGPDDFETLHVRNNLGYAYALAGRTAEAIAVHEQTLPAFEQMVGPDHFATLISRNNLAEAYRAAGRAAEAIPLHEQTLAARERVLGPDDWDTLASRNNLAEAYRAAGRAAEAIPLHEQTLAARERVLGPDHPDTLASRNNLALAHRDAAQQPWRTLSRIWPGRGRPRCQ